MKQQILKEQRDYNQNPRRSTEIDLNFRNDVDHFEPSMTKQADAEAADINHLMQKYTMQEIESWREGDGQFLDLSTTQTYEEAMNVVAGANSAFYEMPASLRAHFQNDPTRMLELVEKARSGKSKEAVDEMVSLGMLTIREKEESPAKILAGIRENTKKEASTAVPDASKTPQDGVKTTKKG